MKAHCKTYQNSEDYTFLVLYSINSHECVYSGEITFKKAPSDNRIKNELKDRHSFIDRLTIVHHHDNVLSTFAHALKQG